MKKKLFMYLIVLVVCLFVGFTAFYAVQNKESFSLIEVEAGGYKCINKGESIELPLLHERPYKSTTVTVESSNTSVLSYNEATKTFLGVDGGVATVTITTSNENYGPYIFDVYVGNGSESNPYYIYDVEGLVKINNDTTANYKLVADLDLRLFNEGVWTPITSFGGNFDGDYHTISNLNITGTSASAGLFAQINEGARVENLIVENVTISGNFTYSGAISGTNKGFIGKCYVNNAAFTLGNTSNSCGGIVGANQYAENKAVISMCQAKNITFNVADIVNAGGIAGSVNASSVVNCQAIVSAFNHSTENSTYANLGGIVGTALTELVQATPKIERVYIIKNNLSMVNSVNAIGCTIGSVIGKAENNASVIVENNYYSSNSHTGIAGKADVSGECRYLSSVELKDSTSYVGFNFKDVWGFIETTNYASINFEGIYENFSVYEVGKDITSADEFNTAINDIKASSAGKEYKVTSNLTIDLNGAEWTPITNFSGKLYAEEGVTLIIKNFTINAIDKLLTGFVATNSGEIENVIFEQVTIVTNNAVSDNARVGVIAGNNTGSIKNCIVRNVIVTSENANVGGLVGGNQSIVEGCSFEGQLNTTGESTNVGGIAGYNTSIIRNCEVINTNIEYTTPVVAGTEYRNVGGIVGLNSNTIDNCVSKAVMEANGLAKLYVGGVVGKNNIDAITSYSYFAGEITTVLNNNEAFVGGIAGTNFAGACVMTSGNDGMISGTKVAGIVCNNYGIVKECYASGGKTSGVKVGGIVGTNFASGNSTKDYSIVVDCYTTQTLEGLKDESVVSGLVSKLEENSIIKNCFGAATIVGKGEFFAESASEFRFVLAENFWEYPKVWVNSFCEWINIREKVGIYQNNIITNYGTAKIQYKSAIIKDAGDTFAEVTEDEFINGDYQDTFLDNGFQSTIWEGIIEDKIVTDPVAKDFYPTLKNAYYPAE